jgi:hypothetical protein
MAGYISMKLSLTLFLRHNGFNLTHAVSVTTVSFALCALSVLYWGYFRRFLPPDKCMIIVSIVLVTLGYLTLLCFSPAWKLLSISCFVVGGALIGIHIRLFVNNHFENLRERQQANHAIQWAMNAGCIFGVTALSLTPVLFSINTLYFYCGMTMLLALLFFTLNYKNLLSFKETLIDQKRAFLALAILLVINVSLVFLLLNAPAFTRLLTLLVFIPAFAYGIYLSFKLKSPGYRSFCMILILCGTAYWIAFSIFASQFPVFLIDYVRGSVFGAHLSPLTVMLADPISNIVFGFLIFMIYKYYTLSPTSLLQASPLLVFIGFFILVIAIKLTGAHDKINMIWPIITITLYAAAEFLFVTTSIAQINRLITDPKHRGFFFGLQKLGLAFSASLAFYLVYFTSHKDALYQASRSEFYTLFVCIMLIALGLSLLFFLLTRLRVLRV